MIYSHYSSNKLSDFGINAKHELSKPHLVRKKQQGRNEKCNCGSGKKYKNCCGK